LLLPQQIELANHLRFVSHRTFTFNFFCKHSKESTPSLGAPSMPQNHTVNRRIVLSSRPTGAPSIANFRLDEGQIPPLAAGQVVLRNLYLSLDPYMRGRMSDAASYTAPVALGDVMGGGTISRIESSLHPDFSVGDLVLANGGWQDYALTDGVGLTKLDKNMSHPSLMLGVLGMPGFTAYMGLLDIGQPKAGETVVVGAASGAVGSVVGQIAKLKGCRVVGIAGGAAKCKYVVDVLGFDACVDHRAHDFRALLAAACPQGIDVYFENVGGLVFDAVLPLLNVRARIPLCGMVAHYNDDGLPPSPDRLGALTRVLLSKRIKMQGFIIFADYGARIDEFAKAMGTWVKEGKIKFREDIVDGLENAPQAFIGLLEGKNFGKLIIRVAQQ
jgi:NADPH-dependent curcumin reductase